MPFIEETDLLSLHKDVEKAQIINDRLLDQMTFKNKELKKSKRQRNTFALITAFFFIGIIIIASFSLGASSIIQRTTLAQHAGTDNILISIDSLEVFKTRLDNLKEKNKELSMVSDFYLAKNILAGQKIYSVQVKSFVDNNVSLASESLMNSLLVKANPFFSYSLGAFETLKEAQSFRYQLIKIGFEDAFVASYKGGKRLKIEDPY